MESKKIIYILGCGRSGSTILGFCLGNADNTLDLGEVIEFAKFKGHPNEFHPGSENYAFWESVVKQIEDSQGVIDFDRLLKLQKRFDNHYLFLLLLLFPEFLLAPFGLREYRKFLKLEYDSIFCQSEHGWYVDSSKYPTRLLHLRAIYGADRIKVVHLIRNPGALANAFQNKDHQSKTKSFLASMVYYLTINLFSVFIYFLTPPENRIHITYEKLVQFPTEYMELLGKKFHLDVQELSMKIENKLPLQRGFIFNGNRMRKKESVVFRKGEPSPVKLPLHQAILSNSIKFLFRL